VQPILKCLLICSLARSLHPQILESLLTTGSVNVGGFSQLLDNSRIHQLADWTSRGLVNSRTRQLAVTDYVDIK